MRLACTILAHRLPRQLASLLSVLRSPRVHIYLHIDRREPVAFARRVTRWGWPGMVGASLDALARDLATAGRLARSSVARILPCAPSKRSWSTPRPRTTAATSRASGCRPRAGASGGATVRTSTNEFFFQSILRDRIHRPVRGCQRFNAVHGLARGASHPRTLTAEDLPAMLASGKLFARKLDAAVDSTVMDAWPKTRGQVGRPMTIARARGKQAHAVRVNRTVGRAYAKSSYQHERLQARLPVSRAERPPVPRSTTASSP